MMQKWLKSQGILFILCPVRMKTSRSRHLKISDLPRHCLHNKHQIMKKIFITIAVISCVCVSAYASSKYTTPKDSKHIDENPHVYATEILNRDFDVIKRVLQILEKVSNCLDNDEPISRETFGEIIEIINEFSDKRHREKEEMVLFPLLKVERGGEKKDFLGRLLMEHVSARDRMRELAPAVNNIYQGKKAKKQLTKIAYGYIKWMKKHMQTEE